MWVGEVGLRVDLRAPTFLIWQVHVSINMEIFLRAGRRQPPSAIIDLPAEPNEVERREVCYAAQGHRIGPSWEASFWHRQLTEEWGIPPAAAPVAPESK